MATDSVTNDSGNSADQQPGIESVGKETEEDNAPEDSSEEETSKTGTEQFNIKTEQQMEFGTGGSLEPKNDAVETTLEEFDVDIDKRERETRIDQPEATGLMVDDRPEVQKNNNGEQSNLFADAQEDQQTLTGESAQNKCLFDAENQE